MTLIRSPFQISISWRGSHFIWYLVNESSTKATNIILFILLFLDGRCLQVKWYSAILLGMMVWYYFNYLMIPFHEKHTAKGSSCNCKTSFEKLFVPFSSVKIFCTFAWEKNHPTKYLDFKGRIFSELHKKFLSQQRTTYIHMWDVDDKTWLVHTVQCSGVYSLLSTSTFLYHIILIA